MTRTTETSRLAAAFLTLLLACSYATAAMADDASGCKNPAWAPQPMPGFVIDSCESKAWDSIDDYDLVQGSKALQGPRTTVTFALKDKRKNSSAAALRDYFVTAGKKAGATLMSDPALDDQVTLKQTTAAGELWYHYQGGSGNGEETDDYSLTTLRIAPVPQSVVARAMTALPDPTAKGCKNPPWLVKQFSFFKLDSCEAKVWDQLSFDLPDGEKTVAGKRQTVNYSLTDEKQNPTALMVQKNYVAALEKVGARLVSDPADESKAILTQKTPAGEFWYRYQGTSGNEEETEAYALTTVQIAPPPLEVVARTTTGSLTDQQGKGCKNPPWLVQQFSYFKLHDCTRRDLDSITLDLASGKKVLAGHYLEVNYLLTDENREPSELYVQKNYINALQKIGATLVSDPAKLDEAVLTHKTPAGELWYIYKSTSGNEEAVDSYKLIALQIGGPAPKTCKLEIYGIHFDFDKADIKPESEPVLTQVLALFTADPSYNAEVGGHTDNVGKPAYNLKLSDRRANAVKAWLVAHGVAASRLSSHGYGDTVPLVPNTSDISRAKNRRVELKKKNCQ